MTKPMEATVTALPIAKLKPAPRYLRLGGLDEDHARMLAECGSPLPPILVQRSLHIIDGAHRVRAAQLRGQIEVDAIVLDDDDRAAFIRAVSINARHGLPLSLGDRKAAAAQLLHLCPDKSDRAIAELAGLSGKTVGAVRRSITDLPTLAARVGRDGRARTVARAPRPEPETDPGGADGPEPMAGVVTLTPGPGDRSGHRRPRDILANLTRDPSLRYTDAGRNLLRGLHQHPSADEWPWAGLLSAVPPHCLPAVARLAQSYAADWQELGDLVEQRMHISENRAS